jgi:hypothetical protein
MDNGILQSSCVCESEPIFSDDMTRLYPIDSLPIDELTFEHRRILTYFIRKVKECMNSDCVVLRKYTMNNDIDKWNYYTILSPTLFTKSFTYKPYNMVRDYLLSLSPLILNEEYKTLYCYNVEQIVNMNKLNCYEWNNNMILIINKIIS